MGRLSGKVAIVTGGAQVVLADVQEDKGRAAAEASEGDILFVKLDVTSEADWAPGVAEATARFGSVDVLVNNAAIARSVAIAQENKAGLERCLAIELGAMGIRVNSVHPGLT